MFCNNNLPSDLCFNLGNLDENDTYVRLWMKVGDFFKRITTNSWGPTLSDEKKGYIVFMIFTLRFR